MNKSQSGPLTLRNWPDLIIGLFILAGTLYQLGFDILSHIKEFSLGFSIGLGIGGFAFLIRRLTRRDVLFLSPSYLMILFSLLFWLVFSYYRSRSLTSNIYTTLFSWGFFHLTSFVALRKNAHDREKNKNE